ncbi:hypothetical protein NKH77_15465 [Streptomyces sp. M19]
MKLHLSVKAGDGDRYSFEGDKVAPCARGPRPTSRRRRPRGDARVPFRAALGAPHGGDPGPGESASAAAPAPTAAPPPRTTSPRPAPPATPR